MLRKVVWFDSLTDIRDPREPVGVLLEGGLKMFLVLLGVPARSGTGGLFLGLRSGAIRGRSGTTFHETYFGR